MFVKAGLKGVNVGTNGLEVLLSLVSMALEIISEAAGLQLYILKPLHNSLKRSRRMTGSHGESKRGKKPVVTGNVLPVLAQ